MENNNSGAFFGGSIGAVLSSLVWIGIGYATGYELGILAVLVGLGCGIGAAMGAKGRTGTSGAMIAAACALVAIVAARFVLVQISISNMIQEAAADESTQIPGAHDDEYWISFIADRLIRDGEQQGEEFDWSDTDYEDDELANDYPPEVWSQAQGRWNGLSSGEREEFCALGEKAIRAEQAQGEAAFRGVASVIGILVSNLHPMALILMGIAVSAAFKTARDSRPIAPAQDDEFGNATPMPTATMRPPGGPTGLPGMPPSGAPTGLPGMPPPSTTMPPGTGRSSQTHI